MAQSDLQFPAGSMDGPLPGLGLKLLPSGAETGALGAHPASLSVVYDLQ